MDSIDNISEEAKERLLDEKDHFQDNYDYQNLFHL